MKFLLFAITFTSLLASVSVGAISITIAEYVGGTVMQTSSDFRGQSFTTTATGGAAFNNITFNLFTETHQSNPERLAPYASGTGFLFSMPFSGDRSTMSSLSAGFLGQATAVDDFWTFDPSMTLFADTQYYFYMGIGNFMMSGGDHGGGTGFIVSGGFAAQPWAEGADLNFRAAGSPVDIDVSPVPDTGRTVWLVGLSVFGLFGWRRLTLILGSSN